MNSEKMRTTMNLFDIYDYVEKLEKRIRKLEIKGRYDGRKSRNTNNISVKETNRIVRKAVTRTTKLQRKVRGDGEEN